MTLAASPQVGSKSPSERGLEPGPETGFEVRLDNFEGPFDLLLSLIAKHRLDITEVSLSRVTDEFIAHVKAGARVDGVDGAWDLEQTTSFLVVASTLLDLKSARLLPQGDVEDEEDLALLEARDLLFARLLQYRAFKQVAAVLEERLARESRRHPRAVGLEERYAGLLPEVLIGIGLDAFAALAGKALEPKPELELSLQHIHAPAVSVREQAEVIVDRLRRTGTMTFRALCGDAPNTLTKVARFLALLELFRENVVAFDQMSPLGELTVRWTGSAGLDVDSDVQIDEFEGAPLEPESPPVERASPPVETARANSSVEPVETTTASVKPVEPVETTSPPVEPVETTTASVERASPPVEPVETTTPPVEPVEATRATSPVELVETISPPVEPVETTSPPVEPVETTRATSSVEPVETTRASSSVEPVETTTASVEPVETTRGSSSVELVETTPEPEESP